MPLGLRLCVAAPLFAQLEGSLALGHRRRVDDLEDSAVAASLLRLTAPRRGVREHMASYGLFGIRDKGHAAVGVAHDLVGDHDGDVVLGPDLDEGGQHLAEQLLAGGELAAANIVDAEEGGHGVDDDEGKGTIFSHDGANFSKAAHLRAGASILVGEVLHFRHFSL